MIIARLDCATICPISASLSAETQSSRFSMDTARLLITSTGRPSLEGPGASLKPKDTRIRSALASATPLPSMNGKPVCFTATLSFLKWALMSHALSFNSSWPSPGLPKWRWTFSFRKEKSEKLMSLISQSQPLSFPETFSMLIAGRTLRTKSRQVSFSWLTNASRASALVKALSALRSISPGSTPCSRRKTSRSMSSFSKCSKTLATVLMCFMSWICESISSPLFTNSDAPLTTLSSSRLLTIASFQAHASWLQPAACASKILRSGRGTSMLRSLSAERRPW
mmetsp:Transcript_47874/g.128076  ORF Transcript_47874/g.128076 Transcript_47874/m.128076 type:complete len:282 (+) Transcript_47874:444-1289(+)